MSECKAGKLELSPSKSPAVLDTTTWDTDAAIRIVKDFGAETWEGCIAGASKEDSGRAGCLVHSGSLAPSRGDEVALASLPDGQNVFLQVGKTVDSSALGQPLLSLPLPGGKKLGAFPADMPTLRRYLQDINPSKGPRALGGVPRLGIGNRHSTAMWPAIFRAMDAGGFAANAIQNSLRELNLLSDLKDGKPAHENYLFGFGTISEGHTGATFEGLLHAGTIASLKERGFHRFGADADHISVKRGPGGLDRAKRVLDAARDFTFFTLDMSDILDYGALKVSSASESMARFEKAIPDPAIRHDLLGYYGKTRKAAGMMFNFGEAEIARFAAKYWQAFEALGELCSHVRALKDGGAVDIEFSIDENPPDYPTADCITSPNELEFLVLEIQRRHLPITHIAPNFGVEKGFDYRNPDGYEGLESRVRRLTRIASEADLMTDCHSGDDLSKATRRVFGQASGGRINFKISPQLQILFAETLFDVQPELFKFWWDDVYRFVKNEGMRGSAFAKECLAEFAADPRPQPSKKLFHYYCFVSVGRRDEAGQFVNRERLYGDLTEAFQVEYRNRLSTWIGEVAEDIFSVGRQA